MAVNYLEESLRGELDSLENDVASNLRKLSEATEATAADIRAHVGVEVRTLQDAMGDGQAQLSGTIEKEIAAVNKEIQRESDEINQRLSTSVNACTSQMDAEIEAVSSALSAAAAELLAGLESVNNRLEAEASATRESFAQNELSGATLRLSDQAAVDDMHQQLQAELQRLDKTVASGSSEPSKFTVMILTTSTAHVRSWLFRALCLTSLQLLATNH